MKRTLFFSDLDSTLIYSGYPEHTCVEYNEAKEVTYMTAQGINFLKDLLVRKDFVFIPCTLRSYEQTARIGFLKNGNVPIIICDNGFSIYENGILDKTWDNLMKENLATYPTDEIKSDIEILVSSNNMCCKIKNNRNAFFTLIFEYAESANMHYATVAKVLKRHKYKLELQGRKLYIIPDFLDKVLAVKYLCKKFNPSLVITAGDSSVDKSFVEEGNQRIIPSHSSLNIRNTIITKKSGISAGEEILSIIYSFVNDSNFNNTIE